MIREVSGDRESFKTLTFRPGLNVILADKSQDASDRQSRNGAGKTSFVELIHFLCGADAKPAGIFRSDALRDWTFSASIDVGKLLCSISRGGSAPGRVCIEGDVANGSVASNRQLPLLSKELSASAATVSQRGISNEQWKRTLGARWFGLPDDDGDDVEMFRPTFRSLFSFAVRRQESGGFQNPIQNAAMQQLWDRQVAVSYLIGLDCTIPGRFQELRAREKSVKELRKAARSGELGRYFGNAAELRTRLTVAEDRATRLRAQLNAFRVVPEYRELEREASEVTGKIDDLNVENLVDHDLIRELRVSLEMESVPDSQDLAKLYREAGIVLPDLPRRRLEAVERFHEAVIANRHSHLGGELESAEGRIAERDRLKDELDRRRGQLMALLKSGGALEHYTGLREELGRIEAEVETLRQRRSMVERLDSTKTELDLERARLVQSLRDDIREREQIVREVILTFEALSQSLYERAGSLTIAETPNGPWFEVHIASERSKGITNMQIFCFDLMLADICTRHGRWPGFLIHDSHLFDGVDERQVAKALQLAAQRAATGGFQYIVTMNSDSVPTEGFTDGFVLGDYVVEPRLTDATEAGGLFGFRFN